MAVKYEKAIKKGRTRKRADQEVLKRGKQWRDEGRIWVKEGDKRILLNSPANT